MNGTQYLDTINVYTSHETEQDGIRENISYALNVLLLLITIYSEMSGVSSCNHNGIVDGFIKVCKENKKKVKKKHLDLEHNESGSDESV